MARRVVVGDLRVQQIQRSDGRRSWTIVWPEGTEHAEADRFLRKHEGSGTQRTYAYVLVDHLRWLERECLTLDTVRLRDLERYMGILGAEVRMPLGEPWRVGKRPYGRAALSITASCLKGFYLHQAALGVNPELGKSLDQTRLPSRAGSPPHASWVTQQRRCRPIRLPRRVRGVGIRRCCPTARGRSYWRPCIRLGTASWCAGSVTAAFGSASCAGCTWSTCTCARTRPAGSAAPRTCMSATARTTRTAPRPRPNTPGASRTAS